MKRLLLLTALFLILCSVPSFAQVEICNNGKDDDGDGLVDCYDGDCANVAGCEGFYIGNDADCQSPPTSFPAFKMKVAWNSPVGTTNHLNRVSIGDLDGDGMPEVVATEVTNDRIFVLSGQTGEILCSLKVSYQIEREVLIANIKRNASDNTAEIFAYSSSNIYAYSYSLVGGIPTLTQLWKSEDLLGNPYYLSIANFDGDEFEELYYRNEIMCAHTGKRLIKSTSKEIYNAHAAPVAADIVGDGKLELISGGRIYGNINLPQTLAGRTSGSGNYELVASTNLYRIRNADNSSTSVADFDLDGNLDVIMTGSHYTGTNEDITKNKGQNTTVFYWNISKNTVKTFIDAFDDKMDIQACPVEKDQRPYKNGWQNGTGRINIADIDGDGKMNAVYVSGKFLYALNDDWTQKWRIVVNEETSGYTGCTMFDFNGDGQSEIVYRDEKFIYIIYGDGSIGTSQKCVSRTNREFPIVADINNDGESEICVTCSFDDNLSDNDFCKDTGIQSKSVVRVLRNGDDNSKWIPARKVWNQHAYFNVNINDDLTVPRIQQKHHITFANSACPNDPAPKERRPLNSFLNQAPFVDSHGCPIYATPDIAFVENSMSAEAPTCPEREFKVSFKITNIGDMAISGMFPITFYAGDPFNPAGTAIKLDTMMLPLLSFSKNSVVEVKDHIVRGLGSEFNLFIVLNDAGTSTSFPITLPNTRIIECDVSNNYVMIPIKPLPAPIFPELLRDNLKCAGLPGSAPTPNNGAVRAYVPVKGVRDTTSFNFYWSDGLVAKPIESIDHIGHIYTGLPEGDYTVYALSKEVSCGSEEATINVKLDENSVTVKVITLQDDDNCLVPSGQLKAVVNPKDENDVVGADPSRYTFEWYEGSDVFVGTKLSISDTLKGRSAGTYSVIVMDNNTGCVDQDSKAIVDLKVTPILDTEIKDAACGAGAFGEATAWVDPSQTTTGYTFLWYNGASTKPTADFTGATYTNLATGKYTVVARHNASQCISSPKTVTITVTPAALVTIDGSSDYTTCDDTQPNGSASASVSGVTDGYTFQWFIGQNTTNALPGGNTPSITGLKKGIYTVRVTDQNNCAATAEVTINNSVVPSDLTLATKSNSTSCEPSNGTITVATSPDDATHYTFFWYSGNVVKTTPDFTETGATLNNLAPGTYTVRAIHKTKLCETAPLTVTIEDATTTVSFAPSRTVRPSDCNDNKGELDIDLSSSGNTDGYFVEWYRGNRPFPEPAFLSHTTSKTSSATALRYGVYTLVVKDLTTGCTTERSFDLPFDDAQILEYSAHLDVNNCAPANNGSMTVLLTKTVGYDETDYEIFVYKDTNDPGVFDPTFNELTNNPFIKKMSGVSGTILYSSDADLEPGFYTFVAVTINPARGTYLCRSVPVTKEIKQITTNPSFNASTPTKNVHCDGPGSALITLTVTAPTATVTDYSFEWFEGKTVTSPILGTNVIGATTSANGNQALNLKAGFYTVRVTKNTGVNGGCQTLATYQVVDDQPTLTLATADIDITSVTRCDLPTMGQAQVIRIKEDGVNVGAANYTFQWFMDNNGTLTPIGTATNSLANIGPGFYQVKPTNTTSLCSTSGNYAFEIKDETINTVSVSLADFSVPSICKTTDDIGSLTALADGTSNSGYTYNWFEGNDTTTPLGTTVGTSANEVATNLIEGFYTIEVINNDTRCRVTDTYELPTVKAPVLITVSSSPLTFCDFPDGTVNQNGKVFAVVTSPAQFPVPYTYEWLDALNNTVSNDQLGQNLTLGTYKIIATSPTDARCSVEETISVVDKRVNPIVTALSISPLTNCSPTNPNGVAFASVEGNTIDYRFDWFTSTDLVTVFTTGAQISNLPADTYTVRGVDIVSGCYNTAQTTIEFIPTIIEIPSISIISQVTSCSFDNGILAADVNGNILDYVFDWYIGATEKPTPDFTGDVYSDLAVGTYLVKATNIFNGCHAFATEDLISDPLFPEFSVHTQATACKTNELDQGTGSGAVQLTNGIELGSIEWRKDGTFIANTPAVGGLDMGIYQVHVISSLGCETIHDVEIKTDIHTFNGISRNGDGQNDYFHINCIENFPYNIVKIYNRAGTLVYENKGYNNFDVFFEGTANRGIQVMGNNLPDGTYFYIIDKNDGSKPVAGYLEIVN
jgi:hypothetical protein